MRKTFTGLALLLLVCVSASAQQTSISKKVEVLLAKMTLDEKVGQLNQLSGDWEATGPVTKNTGDKLQQVRDGKIGSVLNIMGENHTRTFQDAAMKSRLKIPLLFGQDVIHGYSITFPIPLAEAASWDLPAIERSARIAATEASAAGINWTFAPMVDVARDPRWGRVMEGAGEDTYLGSLIAAARVRGFQGRGIGSTDAVMACVKHFAGYGAAIGGRDYNSVDMSLHALWQTYLPPFKAALDAGAATFMNAFNDLNGTPATGNAYLQRDILKGKWGFKGLVVSDWNSIGEMIPHGYAKDLKQAAETAIKAGNDMDMESRAYIGHLAVLVREGKVPIATVNEAVRRILTKKFELGLFDNPYKFINAAHEKATLNQPKNIEAARDMGRKSIVLLKNEKNLLPLSKDVKTIALIGPLSKEKWYLKGAWSTNVDPNDNVVNIYEGLQNHAPNAKILYAQGCNITDSVATDFKEAVETAQKADVVVMAVGEDIFMTGEARSKANIHIPGVQEDLIKAVVATGKPVVVLLMAGRPMIFNWTAEHAPAIVYTWWLGSQMGNSVADVLFGDYNPSGKLPMTFPRSEGQIPLYYNYMNTGRPATGDNDAFYRSSYLDVPNTPQYAFGFGLSYTTYSYSNISISKTAIRKDETITVSFDLKNTGNVAGEEVAQLYIRDMVAQPLRPVKELKDFAKVKLAPGESKRISFKLDKEKLSFYNDKLEWITQPGDFKVMIGPASNNIKLEKTFQLIN
ncbi:beta-glucosidase BglX [Mucilaginibacter conchicola]|uniref:beta-glucosidase n=1 Tax=Mucilaginibacter conchicola TaxID=2303333 RepID=A0A372NXR8_9SPHI|nr:beta-glucosidase BglX [Mucilaginibacter conchicola]RFZ94694.1 beta-glucosidase BglX [Mucilaginibacter conchicola]